MPAELQAELDLFERNRSEWVKHHVGKFALIKGDEVAGFFDSLEGGYTEGVSRWGNAAFLVKQVTERDQIEHIPALTCGLINANL